MEPETVYDGTVSADGAKAEKPTVYARVKTYSKAPLTTIQSFDYPAFAEANK